MKKCFTINCLRTKYDFLGYDELLKSNTYQGIEIFYPYNVALKYEKSYIKNLKELVKNHKNVEVVLHLPFGRENNLINKDLSINYDILNRMKDAIRFGRQFNVKKLTLHLGNAFKEYNVDRSSLLEKIKIILVILCDYANLFKMSIMIENMPKDNELGYSPVEILTLIKNVNKPNLKFILDTGHANVSSYEITDYIKTLGEYIYHVHISDNNKETDEHGRIGTGNIDFDKVFRALHKVKYKELHCLEILFRDYDMLYTFSNDIEPYNRFYRS